MTHLESASSSWPPAPFDPDLATKMSQEKPWQVWALRLVAVGLSMSMFWMWPYAIEQAWNVGGWSLWVYAMGSSAIALTWIWFRLLNDDDLEPLYRKGLPPSMSDKTVWGMLGWCVVFLVCAFASQVYHLQGSAQGANVAKAEAIMDMVAERTQGRSPLFVSYQASKLRAADERLSRPAFFDLVRAIQEGRSDPEWLGLFERASMMGFPAPQLRDVPSQGLILPTDVELLERVLGEQPPEGWNEWQMQEFQQMKEILHRLKSRR